MKYIETPTFKAFTRTIEELKEYGYVGLPDRRHYEECYSKAGDSPAIGIYMYDDGQLGGGFSNKDWYQGHGYKKTTLNEVLGLSEDKFDRMVNAMKKLNKNKEGLNNIVITDQGKIRLNGTKVVSLEDLEILSTEIIINGYIVEETSEGIKIGCTTVSKDTIKQVYERVWGSE